MYNYYSIRILLEFNKAHMYPNQEVSQVKGGVKKVSLHLFVVERSWSSEHNTSRRSMLF
jgi:hypothetical protein